MDKSPDEIEKAVEPVPIGLPKAMENFTRQQMAEFITAALRMRSEKRPHDEPPT